MLISHLFTNNVETSFMSVKNADLQVVKLKNILSMYHICIPIQPALDQCDQIVKLKIIDRKLLKFGIPILSNKVINQNLTKARVTIITFSNRASFKHKIQQHYSFKFKGRESYCHSVKYMSKRKRIEFNFSEHFDTKENKRKCLLEDGT